MYRNTVYRFGRSADTRDVFFNAGFFFFPISLRFFRRLLRLQYNIMFKVRYDCINTRRVYADASMWLKR